MRRPCAVDCKVKNEEEVWKGFLEGNIPDFETLYDIYFTQLYQYGQYFTPNHDIIKDVLHELFIRLWDKRPRLREISTPKAYIFQSFKRNIIRELSKTEKKVAISETVILAQIYPSFEDQFIEAQQKTIINSKLHKAFSKLKDKKKEALFLRFYNNMEYHEIADVLNLQSIIHARTLVYRGLEELKSHFVTVATMLFFLIILL